MHAQKGFFRALLIPLILSLVPGWGHIWVHRATRGLLIFVCFFGLANYALMALLLADAAEPPILARPALALAAGVLVFSYIDILRLTLWNRNKRLLARCDGYLRRAIIHYLRDEYGQAEELLLKVLRRRPFDVPALSYLAAVQRGRGAEKKAQESFKRALAAARGGRWEASLRAEIKRV